MRALQRLQACICARWLTPHTDFLFFFFLTGRMAYHVTRFCQSCAYGIVTYYLPAVGYCGHINNPSSSEILPLKLGVGQNIATAYFTDCQGFFLELFFTLPVHSPPPPQKKKKKKSLPSFFFLAFSVLAVANTGCCVASLNKIGQPVRWHRR